MSQRIDSSATATRREKVAQAAEKLRTRHARRVGQYRLTRYEQETIFSWMHQGKNVLISSTSPVFLRKMDRWGFPPVSENGRKGAWVERHYELPPSHVRVGRRRLDRMGMRTRHAEGETMFRWNEESREVYGLPGIKRGQIRVWVPKQSTEAQIQKIRVAQTARIQKIGRTRHSVSPKTAKQDISQSSQAPISSSAEYR